MSGIAVEAPNAKKPKLDASDDAVAPSPQSRSMTSAKSCETVRASKENLRSVASQKQPNDSLLLVYLEELSSAATTYYDDNAAVYQELARQAKFNQGSVDLASFVLSVSGGGACDVVSKALSKCLKNEKATTKVEPLGVNAAGFGQRAASPLAGLYDGPPPNFFPWNPPYQYSYGQGTSSWRGFRGNRGTRASGSSAGSRGTGMGCDLRDHFIRNCDKGEVWGVAIM